LFLKEKWKIHTLHTHISSTKNKQKTKTKARKNNYLVNSNTEKTIELHPENYITAEKRKEPISNYPIDSTFSAVSFKISYIHTTTEQKHNKKIPTTRTTL